MVAKGVKGSRKGRGRAVIWFWAWHFRLVSMRCVKEREVTENKVETGLKLSGN